MDVGLINLKYYLKQQMPTHPLRMIKFELQHFLLLGKHWVWALIYLVETGVVDTLHTTIIYVLLKQTE